MSEIMPDKRFTEVIDGEQVVRTLTVGGDIIPEEAKDPAKYFTALVNTESGVQQVIKTYLIGIAEGATSDLIRIVAELPEVGIGGILYGVLMPEMSRDDYGIIQFFVWYSGEWWATGAYSIDIDPNGLVYEDNIPYATASKVGGIKQSFDVTTGVWTVVTDNLVS